MADEKNFPIIPESNWWTLRAQFNKAYPATVTASYLASVLKVSNSAAKKIALCLKRLGLVGDDDKPTSRANDWRTDQKYSEVCKEMRVEVYPQELLDIHPDSSDKDAIKHWFSHTCKVGTEMARQLASVYILLTDAQVKSPDEKVVKPKSVVQKKVSAKAKPALTALTIDSSILSTPLSQQELADTTIHPKTKTQSPSLHIDLQIHISPDATSDQIDAIFASMAKHLYK